MRKLEQDAVGKEKPYTKRTAPFPAKEVAVQVAVAFQGHHKETFSGIFSCGNPVKDRVILLIVTLVF